MQKRYQVLASLSVLSMITFLDRIALSSASASIMDDLHLSTVQWGWILGIFTIAYGAFEIPNNKFRVAIDITINVNALKYDLEQSGIIRKFGY